MTITKHRLSVAQHKFIIIFIVYHVGRRGVIAGASASVTVLVDAKVVPPADYARRTVP